MKHGLQSDQQLVVTEELSGIIKNSSTVAAEKNKPKKIESPNSAFDLSSSLIITVLSRNGAISFRK